MREEQTADQLMYLSGASVFQDLRGCRLPNLSLSLGGNSLAPGSQGDSVRVAWQNLMVHTAAQEYHETA